MSIINRGWIASIWKAVRAGQGIEWADFEWYALDHDGLVGMFTSAGRGPVPRSVFRDLDAYIGVAEFFGLLPRKGGAEIFISKPRVDDWRQAAEHGLYGFDYLQEAESKPEGYYMVARPHDPLHAEEVPNRVREWLGPMTLNQTLFRHSMVTKLDVSGTDMEWV
jgi:hypothetical protein